MYSQEEDIAQEDNTAPSTSNASANPPYMQRSTSAPAIAEHVSDAVIGYKNYDVSFILHLRKIISFQLLGFL